MYALDSFEDVQMRLDGTVALYGTTPVYVQVMRGRAGDDVNTVLITSIRDRGKKYNRSPIKTTDKDFHVSGFPCGFVNAVPQKKMTPHTTLVQRAPVRQQRQALSPSSLRAYFLASGSMRSDIFYMDDIIGHTGFADMMEDTYPNWQFCVAKVQEFAASGASVAFARDWAVCAGSAVGHISLWYQTTPVGRFSEKRKQFLVSTDTAGLSFVLPDLDKLNLPYVIE